jgi:7-cyano-7-deazaguanine synthase in queuosine biosynthesis
LNYDAFNALGKFVPGRNNMFNRLAEAWASALGLSGEAASGG